MNKYTGREIALFTDAHGLIDPLEAILRDIKKRGITEIYSLGDNIGVGPNPREVLDLLQEYNVKSVSGNSEYYTTLGIEPFRNYFGSEKIASQQWTKRQLTSKNIKVLELYPPSIELVIGNKNIALCHFANDVRIDYMIRSTWTYQDELKYGDKAYLQFDYTNSKEQKNDILKNKDKDKPFYEGFKSSYRDPLFKGKTVSSFDAIFQGHVHFKSKEQSPTTTFYTVGMAYKEKNIASYVIIHEKENGFTVEEVLVPFNQEKMLKRVKESDMPDKSLLNKYLRK